VETFGMDEADLLLDRPPGGRGDLVTKQTLELRFAAFEAHLDLRSSADSAVRHGNWSAQ